MKLSLSLKPADLKKLLPILKLIQPYAVGLVLIGVFGYTAYSVNAALNVQPDKSKATGIKPVPAITFDKKTINSLEQLQVVTGDVPIGSLGQSNPF